mmetsp:Transcript_35651/g.101599  ORF Transcript_35651/g.101599 Transcript_35651/m.101599 type:complete len:306 (-) Transcript_35651:396-1313(-)
MRHAGVGPVLHRQHQGFLGHVHTAATAEEQGIVALVPPLPPRAEGGQVALRRPALSSRAGVREGRPAIAERRMRLCAADGTSGFQQAHAPLHLPHDGHSLRRWRRVRSEGREFHVQVKVAACNGALPSWRMFLDKLDKPPLLPLPRPPYGARNRLREEAVATDGGSGRDVAVEHVRAVAKPRVEHAAVHTCGVHGDWEAAGVDMVDGTPGQDEQPAVQPEGRREVRAASGHGYVLETERTGTLRETLRVAAGPKPAAVALLDADDVDPLPSRSLPQLPQKQVNALAFVVVQTHELQRRTQEAGER